MPALHRDDGLVHVGQLVREEEEVRPARTPLPGRVVHDQVDLLFIDFTPRRHLILPRLPHEEAVLLEILADDTFIDGGHLGDFRFWILDFRFRRPYSSARDGANAEEDLQEWSLSRVVD